MIELKEKPFYLNDDQIKWVEDTLAGMSVQEKIEQLFCPAAFSADPNFLRGMLTGRNYAGVMFRPTPAGELQEATRLIQQIAKVPMFIAANLEDGGNGAAFEGTYMGRQMTIAATGDNKKAYQLGKICAKEGMALGINYAFAPVVDIDMNFHNPITNVRTYGSDPKKVLDCGSEYLKAAMEEGILTSIKHFPGDGVDERDQHLVTSVNSLSIEEWEETYGKVYRGLIEQGAPTVMVGHIAMPAMEEYMDKVPCKKVIPASVSKNILTGYLRGELGFNGMISTDASPMVGLMSSTERRLAVPMTIENGCDMFLFTKDLDEDIRFMKEGYENGILSDIRLNEAVTRILATKAAYGFIQKHAEGTMVPGPEALSVLQCEEHVTWAKECADQAVTLVKDVRNILPLDVNKHKRILLEIIGDFASNDRVQEHFTSLLEKEGFEVSVYIPETLENIFTDGAVDKFRSKYDLVLYIGNIENASNKTVNRITWHTLFGAGNNLPWFAKEVPTVFVSVGNPYHLYDVPMIPTYVNGYCHSPFIIEAIMDKLMGRSEFKGISPVDPFCGTFGTDL